MLTSSVAKPPRGLYLSLSDIARLILERGCLGDGAGSTGGGWVKKERLRIRIFQGGNPKTTHRIGIRDH